MSKHEQINYLEFPAKDIAATQAFFKNVFGWEFVDYGPEYCSVTNAAMDLGFFKSEQAAVTANGSVLVVFYSEALEQTQQKLVDAGASIVKEIFAFPGGRRFHFADPNGNEYAVWSDKGLD